MEIYVVQPGDTIYTIAQKYGVSTAKLIRDNEMPDPYMLVPGENIIILFPDKTYYVKEGDTLEEIAASNNITVGELLRNNPFISDMEYIYPGEELAISYNRTGRVSTHGYTNTFIDRKTLRKTLPYLSYLTIFNYRTAQNGEVISNYDDTDIIRIAKEYGVLPFMLMTTLTVQGEVDLELTYDVLISEDIQNRLFDNVLKIVREKGYSGVNISAQFITAANQELFNRYTQNLSERLKQEGYLSVITINPKLDMSNNDITFETINYTEIGSEVDATLFLQYKWGFNFGPPSPVSSINATSIFLDYVLTQIPSEKIFVGIPTIGYDWELPYVPGFSRASALTLDSVIVLARNVGANIEFDEISQTPYYYYEDPNDKTQHKVWFINAVTINTLIELTLEKDITGTGIWNIMQYFTQLWMVINSQYEILKYLPEF
ncbi:LysM peptidoglycan-binding domain-containing protein [Anaerocolumna sp. MB42-C2]|uniref:LysM peptidoglycan-binding domain-containing protein n=1 Tax=Anaerocolumna sp. MB42-C2 TaxID=3070997 RepID=UPI0027E0BC82|nr:LysM peptidoglycan-binding domain-containing protein [Anaerocolumna sp. MB42-C2]WMJ86149.1 LysM peptidoglycan-binding domain-containing protein [Anaerocolumna sp. MB42-C2]